MDLNSIAADAGLSTEEVLDIARKIDAFATSLTPRERTAWDKLSHSVFRQPPDKRSQIQHFLATQVDSTAGPVAGVCIVNNSDQH
jgi:hypothetical protein